MEIPSFALPVKGKEVILMEVLTQMFVSVTAHIIGYFVCRWLDRQTKGR